MLLELILACTTREAPDSGLGADCPELSGFSADQEQLWRVHGDSVELAGGDWTRSIQAGEEVTTWAVGSLESFDGNQATFEDRRRYRCDEEGLWWLERELSLSVDDGESVRESLQLTEWEQPPLMLARDVREGSWSGVERYTLTIDGEPDAPLELDYTIELGPWVLVTVPAGTFEAAQWRKGDRVEFLAPGLGRIRDEDAELL